MLCIEVELLTGRYAATAYNDRTRAEWPPHPARFFSALVAAMHDCDPVDEDERAALKWLEQQTPPSMGVDMTSVDDVLGRREVRDVFVPVNDVSVTASLESKLRAAEEAVEQANATLNAKEIESARNTQSKELKKLTKDLEKARAQFAKLQASLKDAGGASDSELKTARAVLPDQRTRQMRTFPVVFPAVPCFRYFWQADPGQTTRTAIDRLCERVTRLGHSSSLVRCLVVDQPSSPNLVPSADGGLVLRTVGAGQLERLEREYERHQAIASRVLPARPQRYGAPVRRQARIYPESIFSEEWILFERVDAFENVHHRRIRSARPVSSRGTDLAQALRRALFEVHGTPPGLPPSLTGHDANGTPTQAPHLAFVALPHVNHEHSDAGIKGLAVVLPRSLASADRGELFQLIAQWERERAVDHERTVLELGTDSSPPLYVRRAEYPALHALNPATWCKPAARFITATPIALDRYPGNLRSAIPGTARKADLEARRCIASACERIGLPPPDSVEISFAPLLPGAQPARDFVPRLKPGQHPRVRVHADIRFSEAVRGPVILGSGRYLGLGLCLPVRQEP